MTTSAVQPGSEGPLLVDERAAASPRAAPLGPEEFASRCEEHLDQVWRQLRTMGVAERYLDDATQEVFLVAYRKIHEFEGRSQLRTWLYAIAFRVGSNYRRKARRDASSEPFEEHASEGLTPERLLANKREAALIQSFCDALSEKLRDVFVLCLLEGQPVREVALLLNVPENTIYSRIRLVREAFRKELARRKGQRHEP